MQSLRVKKQSHLQDKEKKIIPAVEMEQAILSRDIKHCVSTIQSMSQIATLATTNN